MQIKSDLWYWVEWATSTVFGLFHQRPYNESWDRVLNELLDKYEDSAKWCEYTVLLGEVEVWAENRMRSYGYLFRVDGKRGGVKEYRPSVSTMIRLAKLQDQAGMIGKEEEEEYWNSLVAGV